MSAEKSKLVQNRLNRVGSKDQVYVLVGNTSKAIENNNTIQSDGTLWTDSELAYRVSRNDVVGVVPNYTWSKSNVYVPWSSQEINTSKFYVYNKSNGMVYLCISNNNLNRKDLMYSNASTLIPTHEYGMQQYADGYTWLALYKITPALLRFVSTNWIPVISLNDYSDEEFTSKYSEISNFCDGSIGSTGNCGVYFKENTLIPTSETTNDSYLKGDIYTTISNISCSECFNLFSDNESEYVSEFFGSETPTSTLQIKTPLQKIEELINLNIISTASPYYWLYQTQINGPEDGSIISAFIDLSGYSINQLQVTQENPTLIISSSTGKDAIIKLKTYKNSAKKIIINGIEVISAGRNYKDYSLQVPDGLMDTGSISSQLLLSSITINIDYVDFLGTDPVVTLGVSNILTNARINLEEVNLSNITLPEKVNFYGIVVNPLQRKENKIINPQTKTETEVSEVVAGQTLGRFKSTVLTNNITAKLIDEPTELLEVGSEIVLESIDNEQKVKTEPIKITAKTDSKTIELTSLNEKNLIELDILSINEEKLAVDEYVLPPLVQYTGKIINSRKISDISLGNLSNTKIINIVSITPV